MILGLEIVTATLSDAGKIKAITLDAFDRYIRKNMITNPIRALTETLEDITKDIENGCVLIASMYGHPAGSIRILDLESGIARISRFGVTTDYRKIGVGHELLKKADEIMQISHVKSAYLFTALSNKRLIHFYKRHGYFLASVDSKGDYPRAKLVKNF
ncbi:MAG: GNAT family N-acetyltransferase [Bacillota bacterium]